MSRLLCLLRVLWCQSLTAGCSKGVLVLIYLLFGLCIGLTIGGVVREGGREGPAAR